MVKARLSHRSPRSRRTALPMPARGSPGTKSNLQKTKRERENQEQVLYWMATFTTKSGVSFSLSVEPVITADFWAIPEIRQRKRRDPSGYFSDFGKLKEDKVTELRLQSEPQF